MTEQTPQLEPSQKWSNERIETLFGSGSIVGLRARTMRDEMQARIDELENSIKILYQSDGSKLDAYALGFNNGYDFAEGLSNERIATLEAVIAYIDSYAPRADATCAEPGISLSEAARREMKEQAG